MNSPLLQLGLYLLAAAIVGGIIVWLIQRAASNRKLARASSEWQTRLDQATRQKEKLHAENNSLKSALEAERSLLEKHKHMALKSRTELESLHQKSNSLSKNLFNVSAERDQLDEKLSNQQNQLTAAKQRITELENEFAKTQAFYKAQIQNSFDERKTLERKVEDAKSERESLSNLLNSTKSEYESVSNLLASAQSRLEKFDALEQKVISLEADNAELKHEAALAAREVESLQRDVAELDELKAQNRELAHCLKSMENSRKQYESNADRYRKQYEQSEQESETLRIKLGDIEKNLSEMQRSQNEARTVTDNPGEALPPFGLKEPQGEIDDLTEIVGIGKVFQETLHRLGVFHFRQIAAFGPAEIARVNAELKEFKGRIEHDDWVGQAKELHFKKYGGNGEE